jgi:hypothetical protein
MLRVAVQLFSDHVVNALVKITVICRLQKHTNDNRYRTNFVTNGQLTPKISRLICCCHSTDLI